MKVQIDFENIIVSYELLTDEDGTYEFFNVESSDIATVDIEITESMKDELRQKYSDEQDEILINKNPMKAYGLSMSDFI